jgi:small subunit ribosomal protein S16
MLKIRLQRVGRKAEPSFRLVLTDSKNSTKSGKYLEVLGNYDARRGEKSEFKADRISHWMNVGAQTSDTVHNLLVSKKLINAKKINKLPLKKAIKKESEAAPVAEISVEEKAPETVVSEETPA